MSENDDPIEPARLDLSSEPASYNGFAVSGGHPTNPSKRHQRQQVNLYFGCCKIFAQLTPPVHVLQGKSDIWRAHCPRCAGLVEILFE